MHAVTREDFRRLASMRPSPGKVLSLYLDLDPQRVPTPGARRAELDVLLCEARRQCNATTLTHAERRALDADIDRVARFVGQKFSAKGSHGLAVFSASEAGLFEAIKLPRGIAPTVTVEDRPYVEPLLPLVQTDVWCVLLLNRKTGRILVGDEDGLREVSAQHDDVPGRHEQGGWAQARYQRHVDAHIADHVKAAAERARVHFMHDPFAHLVIGCPDDLWPQIRTALHRQLMDRLAGRIEVDVENSAPGEILDAARTLLAATRREHEDELIERLQQQYASGRAVAGNAEVIQALATGRVEIVLVQDGFHGSQLDRAVHLAADQGAELETIRQDGILKGYGSIAALLRY